MAAPKPTAVTIRTYRVGFGDCYLLTVHYPGGAAKDRHVLIDFGSTHKADGEVADLQSLARAIAEDCGGKLHLLVATHRHKDHIAGFATSKKGGPGRIIAGLEPDMVLQPWTEDPDLARDATAPLQRLAASAAGQRQVRRYTRSLADMQRAAAGAVKDLRHLDLRELKGVADRIRFIGEDNIANKSAVENLIRMGRREGATAVYAHADMKLPLATLLPGVKVTVLGPPTLEQSDKIASMTRRHAEYWNMRGLAGARAQGAPGSPFAAARKGNFKSLPPQDRWLVRRLRAMQADQLLAIVRSLDDAMNNTSLILLFKIGRKTLLFPGDAQFENWEFTLRDPKKMKLLAGVDVYKVGHHGSLNATPRSVWASFARKGKVKGRRLAALLSTLDGAHGHEEDGTEVPRGPLLKVLEADSDLIDTRRFAADRHVEVLTLKV